MILALVKILAVGWASSCAALDDGRVLCWGERAPTPLDQPHHGPRPVPLPSLLVDLSTSDGTICAVDKDGAVLCLGSEPVRAPRKGDFVYAVPGRVEGIPPARSVRVGRTAVCALSRAGEVHCWGDNSFGSVDPAHPQAKGPAKIAGIDHAVELAVGSYGVCARTAEGRVGCWGNVLYEDEAKRMHTRLRWMKLPPSQKIRMGEREVCSQGRDGSLGCWGDRFEGEQVVAIQPPGRVIDFDIDDDLCVLVEGGALFCDRSAAEQALDGKPQKGRDAFVRIPEVDGSLALGISSMSSCALTHERTLRCWGMRDSVEVDEGFRFDRPVPVSGVANATALAAFDHTTCAVSRGEIYCWGDTAAPARFPACMTPSRSQSVATPPVRGSPRAR
jgi:alpha-tubulin suppressor-like RCC1 family protein